MIERTNDANSGFSFPLGFRLASVLSLGVLAVAWTWAMGTHPQESDPALRQQLVGLVASVMFVTGYGLEVLANRLGWRLAGVHLMAAAAIVLLLGWRWDAEGVAIAAVGWLGIAVMTVWGWKLFGAARGDGEAGSGKDGS